MDSVSDSAPESAPSVSVIRLARSRFGCRIGSRIGKKFLLIRRPNRHQIGSEPIGHPIRSEPMSGCWRAVARLWMPISNRIGIHNRVTAPIRVRTRFRGTAVQSARKLVLQPDYGSDLDAESALHWDPNQCPNRIRFKKMYFRPGNTFF